MPSQSGSGLSIRPEKQTRDERRHQEGRAMNASLASEPLVIPVTTTLVSSVTNFMSECRLFFVVSVSPIHPQPLMSHLTV